MKINTLTAVRKLLTTAVFGAVALLSAPKTSAAMALIYELDHRFSGASMDCATPWAVATFSQVDANTVELHMRANNISTGYLNNWWFNFNGNASALEILNVDGTGATGPLFATTTINSTMFNAGRDAIRWNFSFYGGTAQDFTSNDDVYVTLYSASGLDIHQFDKSVGAGVGPNLYSGANVSGLAGGTEKIVDLDPRYEEVSAPPHFVLVPEASSAYLGFLLLTGALGGEIVRRKKA